MPLPIVLFALVSFSIFALVAFLIVRSEIADAKARRDEKARVAQIGALFDSVDRMRDMSAEVDTLAGRAR
jgi:hypothetical protein